MQEITLSEAKTLATHFYRLMDGHVPVDVYRSVIDPETIIVGHGSTVLKGWSEFQQWYDGVTRACFDQVHTISDVSMVTSGLPATVQIVARWQASKWKAPAPRTGAIDAVATHHLTISRDTDGDPVVSGYIMTDVKYSNVSATL